MIGRPALYAAIFLIHFANVSYLMFSFFDMHQNDDSTSSWTDVTIAFLLSLLQASQPRSNLPPSSENVEVQQQLQQQRQYYISILSAVGPLIDRLHRSLIDETKITTAAAADNNKQQQRELNFRSAGWLCYDVLAQIIANPR